jgi:hypothetical protein
MITLRQLFYLSRADTTLNTIEVRHILSVSQRNNRRKDITGCLLYSGQHFAQVLEGHATDITGLVSRITQDPRHHGMVVAMDREVGTRSFPDWSMGVLFKLDVADRIEALLAGERLSADQTFKLFHEIEVDTVMGTL